MNELTPQEYELAINSMKEGGMWNPAWNNQQHTDQGLTFPKIASKYGNSHMCENDKNPDPKIPAELFNFDLILNGRKFRVICDTLMRIKSDEDLAQYDDQRLAEVLEQCSSYRITCYCAYIAAYKEKRRWEAYHEEWMALRRKDATAHIRAERLADRAAGLRKEIGQITAQELNDWILTHHASEHRHNLDLVADWEENAKVFLELRDTLHDRGMHLQTLLRRVYDHTAKSTSSGNQF